MTLISTFQQWWQTRLSPHWQACTDSELLNAFSDSGHSGAMDELIQRHSTALYHFLLTLSDATLAEDLSQQVWFRVIEHPDRYRKDAAQFRTWLFTVGRNAAIDELRRQNRWQWESLTEDADVNHLTDHTSDLEFSDRSSLSEEFEQALNSMPFLQREALTLQLEGFSLADIATITQNNSETIKSRLRFARQHLKHQLEVNHD